MADVGVQAPTGDTLLHDQKPQADAGADSTTGKGSSESLPEWMSDLPDPLKGSKSLARYRTKDAVAKAYVELEGKLSKSTVVPGKDAKPEEWEAFYSRVGRPQAAKDYDLAPPEGYKPNDAFMGRLRDSLHQAGLSQAQAARIFGFMAGESTETERAASEAKAQAYTASVESLKKAWGLEYESNLENARRFVEANGGDEAIRHFESLGIANDPVLLSMLSAAGKAVGQHRIVTGDVAGKGKQKPYAYMSEGRSRPGG